MPNAAQAVELRTSALTAPVSRREVAAFFRWFAQQHPEVVDPRRRARRVLIAVGTVVIPIGLLAMSVGISEELAEPTDETPGQLAGMSVMIALMVVAGIILVWWSVRTTMRSGTPRRHFRLWRFAADNGMSYLPGPYRGTHLTPWTERGYLSVSRVMRPLRTPRPVEFANYELIYGESGRRHTQFGGYCAIRLATTLPHILLKAQRVGRRGLSVAAMPAGAQRLSLEGDFDTHFALYCPIAYERDALYLFTPDVMARLIDDVSGFDVEIVDDWLFLTRSSDVVTLDPATWHGLIDAANALGGKIAQWERWRDERMPQDGANVAAATGITPGVARPGRRLRMVWGGATWIWIAVTVLLLGGVLLANLL